MPLVTGNVVITSEFGDTATTVIPGPISVVTVGAQGPAGPPGPPGPPAAALIAPAGVDLLTVGTVVVLTTAGTLILADPTNMAHATLLLGMTVSTGRMGANIEYLIVGEITGLSTLTVGQDYWLGLNGTLSTSYEAPGATWFRYLGNAESSTKFILDKQTPITIG